jgi:hypothetical protein
MNIVHRELRLQSQINAQPVDMHLIKTQSL